MNFKDYIESKKANTNTLYDQGLVYKKSQGNTQFDMNKKRFAVPKVDYETEHNVVKTTVDGFEVYFVDNRNYVQNYPAKDFKQMIDAYHGSIQQNNSLKDNILRYLVSDSHKGRKIETAEDEEEIAWFLNTALTKALSDLGNQFAYDFHSKNQQQRNKMTAWYMRSPGEALSYAAFGSASTTLVNANEVKIGMTHDQLANIAIKSIQNYARTHPPGDLHRRSKDDPMQLNKHYEKLISDTIHKIRQLGAKTEQFHIPIIARYVDDTRLAQGTANSESVYITIYINDKLKDDYFVHTLAHEFGHMIYSSLDREAQEEVFKLARSPLQMSGYGKINYVGWEGKVKPEHNSGNEWLSEFFGLMASKHNSNLSIEETKIIHQVFNIIRFGYSPSKITYRNTEMKKQDRQNQYRSEPTVATPKDIKKQIIANTVSQFYPANSFSGSKTAILSEFDYLFKDEEDYRKIKRKINHILSKIEVKVLKIQKIIEHKISLSSLKWIAKIVDELQNQSGFYSIFRTRLNNKEWKDYYLKAMEYLNDRRKNKYETYKQTEEKLSNSETDDEYEKHQTEVERLGREINEIDDLTNTFRL